MNISEVTAVICTLKEEYNIKDCVECIKENGVKKIILIDASSRDKTVDIARKLAVKCFVVPKKTIAFQRQYGVDVAKTKYVCFVDADNRLEKNCIVTLLKYINKTSFVGVAAQKIRLTSMNDYWSMGWDWHNRTTINTLGEKMVIGTPAMYLTDVLKKVRYETELVSADDNVLCYKLSKLGYKVGTGPGVCYERMVASFDEFKRKLLGYGKGDAEFIIANPERWYNMGTHALRNYFLRGQWRALINGRFDLMPYYFFYGIIRFYGMVKALFTLLILRKRSMVHPGYTKNY
ncbi:MAG: hypothetical protein US86_C0001G0143 [Candidatus Daviesbacteria bacterium GW2011_GWA2_38_24]|uniref:Glycosyltransferase 2-like domain-containing protein n=1 Tax=Candidatus Daviesbacteria bacterium GW2011_GWA2_38_24 TaxID=1618422 RepID=A0A0G0MQN2_9BACT|nr:MAG: hypothetical protein US86_C0001G0143 [Candidatus Daviesbacteria bacterium GW2011_GWA2_38_24]KKQ80632.1 MAG: hypothetical protein UT01_C0008G0004 [Candidatus Daviesbacteria bacterium GW2011_GWA1_38_7]OGE24351.1 MAG: hypothetical protein A2688_03845 [Candidatus Daviesbacteria bacterium RIFCSPHIGHO2_01_FULL_38_8]